MAITFTTLLLLSIVTIKVLDMSSAESQAGKPFSSSAAGTNGNKGNSLPLSPHAKEIKYLPYKPGSKDYALDIMMCYRQMHGGEIDVSNITEENAFNFTVGEACTEYEPYCDDQSSKGCCAFDSPDYKNLWQLVCWANIHSIYDFEEINLCFPVQCTSLYMRFGCLINPPCNASDFVPMCQEYCLSNRSVAFDWLWSDNDRSSKTFLDSCYWTDSENVFGCPSSVALVNHSVVTSCQLKLNDAANSSETYSWTVFNHGKQLDYARASLTATSKGDLRVHLSNLSVEDNNKYGLKCYVERWGNVTNDVSILNNEGQLSKGGDTPFVDAIGFEEAPLPYIVDPLRNFQTEAIQRVDFGVQQHSDDKYNEYTVFTCNMTYHNDRKYVHLVRYLWIGILLFDGWSLHGFDSSNKQFGDGHPIHQSFPEVEMLASHHTVLVDFWGGAELDIPENMTIKLRSEKNILDKKRGSFAVCSVYTAVGLFSREIILSNFDYKIKFDTIDVALTVGVTLVLYVTLTLSTIILRMKYRPPVLLTVIKQSSMQTNDNYRGSTSSSSLLEDADGYLPMRDLTAVRHLEQTNPPLETVPESDVVRVLSPRNVRAEAEGISVFDSPSPPITPLPTRAVKRRLLSLPSMSDSSTTSSIRPGISVRPSGDTFSVKFSKLPGDSDQNLVNNRRFNVDVPPELECLKVHPKRLQFHEWLGSGNFGVVYRAELTEQREKREVAGKVLREDATFEALKDLVLEASFMAMVGKHENINSLQAVSFGKKPCLVTEFCKFGDLKHALTGPLSHADAADMFPLFYSWSAQIGAGVHYLHDKKIVHRDLACRNVLLDGDLCCKVADFGLARDISDSEYYRINTKKCLPYRWLSPEIFMENTFTFASDVWAFAVTIWEIFQFGSTPYSEQQTFDTVREYVMCGGRLMFSSQTDPGMKSILGECFNESVACRPSMVHILPVLQAIKASKYKPESKELALRRLLC